MANNTYTSCHENVVVVLDIKMAKYNVGDSITIPSEHVEHVWKIVQHIKSVSLGEASFDFVSIVKAFSDYLSNLKVYGWSVKRDVRHIDAKSIRLFRDVFRMSRFNMNIAEKYGAWMATVNKDDNLVSSDKTNVSIRRQLYQSGACDYLVRGICIGVMYAWSRGAFIKISSRSHGILTLKRVTIESGSISPSVESGFRNPLIVVSRKKEGSLLDYYGSFPLMDISNDPTYGHAWLRIETHENITFWAEVTPAQFGIADSDIVVRYENMSMPKYSYEKDCDLFWCNDDGKIGGDVESFIENFGVQLKSLDEEYMNNRKNTDGSFVLRR